MQRRFVIRWANVLRTKSVASGSDELRDQYVEMAKRMNIIENVITIHRSWQARTGEALVSCEKFNSSYASLEAFAAAPPVVGIDCPFFFDFRLQILVKLVQ